MITLVWWLDKEATFSKGTVTFPVNREDFESKEELEERLSNLTLMHVNVRYQVLGAKIVPPHPEKVPTEDHTRLV